MFFNNKSNSYSIKRKLNYLIEIILLKGIIYQVIILSLVALSFIISSTVFIYFITSDNATTSNLNSNLWKSFLWLLDPGNLATAADEGGYFYILIALFTSLVGLVIISTLVGFIIAGIDGLISEYKKGRSQVLEKNHIVILGWAPKIYEIVDQLITGYALSTKKTISIKKLCITILAEKNKSEMEDLIEDYCKEGDKAKIICRSGNPILMNKLEMLSLPKAKSILVLAPELEDPDSYVMKTVLALSKILENHSNKDERSIIAEVSNKEKENVIINAFKHNNIENYNLYTVMPEKIISALIVQTSMQNGLSRMYEELLSFNADENEIYIIDFDSKNSRDIELKNTLVGKKFNQIINCFDNASIIGLVDKDDNIKVNPLVDGATIIEEYHKIIAIAKDRNYITPSDSINDKIASIRPVRTKAKLNRPHINLAIIGWNRKIYDIIEELGKYVSEDTPSYIKVYANIDFKTKKEIIFENITGIKSDDLILKQSNAQASAKVLKSGNVRTELEINNIYIEFIKVDNDIMCPKFFKSEMKSHKFEKIILLNYSGLNKTSKSDYLLQTDINRKERSDSKTIETLINLKECFKNDVNISSVVSEIELAHNKAIAPKFKKSSEFIISDQVISYYLGQVIYKPECSKIYEDILFSAEGSEIYLKPIRFYLEDYENTNKIVYEDLIKQGVKKKEVIIGYYDPSSKMKKPIINPNNKTEIIITSKLLALTISEDYYFI